MKLEAIGFSEMLVPVVIATRHHMPQVRSLLILSAGVQTLNTRKILTCGTVAFYILYNPRTVFSLIQVMVWATNTTMV
jgi:hypothetical protein